MTLTSETRAPVGARPVRLQLSRKKGFDLQAHSRAANGLPAVKVVRPSPWGNPFIVTEKMRPGVTAGPGAYGYVAVPTAQDAVDCYAEMMAIEGGQGERSYELRKRLPELRGRNLACWCSPGSPCHADVLLELANGPVCEPLLPANESQNEGEPSR